MSAESGLPRGAPRKLSLATTTPLGPAGFDDGFDDDLSAEAPLMTQALGQLEGFARAARGIENELARERQARQKFEREARETLGKYERLVKEQKDENYELHHEVGKLKTALGQHEFAAGELKNKVAAAMRALQATRAELGKYQGAWAGVLQREREAKLIISESEQSARRVAELESRLKAAEEAIAPEKARRAQAERHAQTYQSELRHALVRIHSAEAKFAEMSKEHQVLARAKRDFEAEVAKVEASVRERAQWELVQEKERLKTELSRELAAEREKARAAEAERDRLKQDLKDTSEALAALHGVEAERDAARERVARLERELEAARLAAESASRRAAELEQALAAGLAKQARARHATARKIARARVRARRAREEAAVRMNERAGESARAAERALERAGGLDGELRSAQAKAAALEGRVTELSAAITAERKRGAALISANEGGRRSLLELKAILDARTQRVSELEGESLAHAKRISELETLVAARTAAAEKADQELASALDMAQSAETAATKALASLRESARAAEANAAELEARLDILSRTLVAGPAEPKPQPQPANGTSLVFLGAPLEAGPG